MIIEKKVAIVYATDFDLISRGGIQNFIKLLAQGSTNKDAITYISLCNKEHIYGSKNIKVKLQKLLQFESFPIHLSFALALSFNKKVLMNFDVIVLHRPEYALFFNHPNKVLVLHGGTWNALRAHGYIKGFIHALIEIIAIARCSKVLSVNPKGQSMVSNFFTQKLTAIRVPLNPIFISKQANNASSTIFSSSRLEPEKQISKIIEISQEAGIELIICGEGSLNGDQKFMDKMVQSKNISYLGFKEASEIAALYGKGGYFLALGLAEGYPLACVEAMAAGLQVITKKHLTGLSQLEKYGAYVASDYTDIVTFLKQRNRVMTESQRLELIMDHESQQVHKEFWNEIVFIVKDEGF